MSPQSGSWMTDPEAYRAEVDRKLGGRSALEVLGKTAGKLKRIVDANADRQLRARPFEGKWTPLEVIGHLGDGEWAYGYRIRMVLSTDKPHLPIWEQESWVAVQRHNERYPHELVNVFSALRDANLTLWRMLGDEELQRVGVHDKRGPESVAVMLNHLAVHDLHHIDQINRYLTAGR